MRFKINFRCDIKAVERFRWWLIANRANTPSPLLSSVEIDEIASIRCNFFNKKIKKNIYADTDIISEITQYYLKQEQN